MADPRYAIVRVDDEWVAELEIRPIKRNDHVTWYGPSFMVPVPSADPDLLMRAAREAVDTLQEDGDDFALWARTRPNDAPDQAEHFHHEAERKYALVGVLRQAFGLNEEEP